MSPARPVRSNARRRGAKLVGGIGVLLLAVSGCSSPDLTGPVDQGAPAEQTGSADQGVADPQAAISSVLEQLESMGVDADGADRAGDDDVSGGDASDGDDVGSDDDAVVAAQPPPITRWLPAEPTGDPAGWQRSPIQCLDRTEAIGSSYVGFAVPADWELGRKSGGSGSPASMGFDYGFRPADLGDVTVSIESDSRDGDGQLVPYDGQPESDSTFDYDYTRGDDTVRVTFESVGAVPVGDSTAELYIARPEQAPDRLKDVAYKARIDQFDMPQRTFDGSWNLLPRTFVIEISYRPDEGEVPEETVKSILSSLVMPDCTLQFVVALAEVTSQLDIDGDGHISDQQDYMDALQAGG